MDGPRPLIYLLIRLKIAPKYREEFEEFIEDLMERTRVREQCVFYEAFALAEDENSLLIIQGWTTRKALETYWTYCDLAQLKANSELIVGEIETMEMRQLEI